jgi:membrane fusion protein, heavy metal efflux system
VSAHNLLKINMKHLFSPSILLLSLLAIGCNKNKAKETTVVVTNKTALFLTDQQMKFIKLDTVRLVPAAEQFTAVGEVSFAEDNVVRIYPIVSGAVESVNVALGDYVQKGQLLATFLSTDISLYQRDYSIAHSNFEVEEKNLTRAQELFKSGMMSEKDLAQAKNSFNNARSEYDERKQVLELYGGSNQQDAIFRVTAPRAGYIVERNINAGTQIRTDNGTNIFTISDLKSVWIWANVHESDIAKVHEGDAVTVKTIAFPDELFNGKIDKISTMLDPDSRVVRVRTELSNSKGLLKPEMFATVVITPKSSEKVTVVPNNSIVLENNQYYVMVETGKNEFKKTQVEPNRVFHRFTEVKEGVKLGDLIVSEGSLFVLTAYNQL